MSQKYFLWEFLRDTIDAAQPDSPFYGARLRFTHFEYTDEEDFGICLGNVVSNPNGGVEYDARLIVTTYCRIGEVERDDRYDAYEQAKTLALAVQALLQNDPGLGGRTCSTRVGLLVDDFDELSAGQAHAVNNLYVVLNQISFDLPSPWQV